MPEIAGNKANDTKWVESIRITLDTRRRIGYYVSRSDTGAAVGEFLAEAYHAADRRGEGMKPEISYSGRIRV